MPELDALYPARDTTGLMGDKDRADDRRYPSGWHCLCICYS
jgi:hypothetical protein